MFGNSSDDPKPTGRLRALVRISDSRGSEVASQKSMIDGFARGLGLPILHWYEDLDRKRWQYLTSQVIVRIKEDARLGLFDWLVVDRVQRIGTFDEQELFHFLVDLKSVGVRVWSVAEGDKSKVDMISSLNAVVGSQAEMKEQTTKAQNVARGMRNNALMFHYNGSTLPHGYDRVCLSTDGVERFRVIEDGKEPNPNYEPGSKDPGRCRWLNWFQVVYPNGHEERRINPPGKNRQERYDFAVSVRTSRVEDVKMAFRMYADGYTRTAIAKHLNALGGDMATKSYWQATNLTYMLANPIYGGEYEWRKSTGAIYSTVLPDGAYEVVPTEIQRRRRAGKSATVVPPEGRIRAGATREELRLVDAATLAKVRARLADELAKGKGSRRPRSDSFWLQPFLRCGHCGGPMRGHNGGVANAAKAHFLCGAYDKASGLKAAGGCVPCRITRDDLADALGRFLSQYGRDVDSDLEAVYHRQMEHLEIPRSEKGVLLTRLRDEMEEYVLERATPEDALRLDSPGGWSLMEAYRHYRAREDGGLQSQIDAIECEIGDLAVASARFKEGSVALRKTEERIADLESQAARLRAAFVPLDERIDSVHRQLSEITGHIREVIASAGSRQTRQAGESLRKVVERIEVYSTPNPRAGGPNPGRVPDRIRFVPIVGEAVDLDPPNPPSSASSEVVERARELLRDHTPNMVATILNGEGHRSVTGKKWRRNGVARLLGLPLSPVPTPPSVPETERQTRTPRRARDGRGG